MKTILKRFENQKVKITVEERQDNSFIATLWLKDIDLEVDRRVFEFETFGGACATAFDLVCEACLFGGLE
jgi:hypothetical protein